MNSCSPIIYQLRNPTVYTFSYLFYDTLYVTFVQQHRNFF
jgi:hypothetical protein